MIVISNPLISIIIPSAGRSKSLFKLLQEIAKQSYHNYEVIIIYRTIDKYEKKKSLKQFKHLNLRLEVQEKQGLVDARNNGISLAKGDIIVFTDDDIIPTIDWLKELVSIFLSNNKVGGVSGPTIIPEDKIINRDLLLFTEKFEKGNIFWRNIGKQYFRYIFDNEPYSVGKFFKSGAFSLGANYTGCLKNDKSFEVMDLQVCNMAYRANIIRILNGFDPAYTSLASYSEPDLSFRVRKLGYKLIFNPKAVIYHLPSRSGIFKERVEAKSEIQNFLLFYFKHIKIRDLDGFCKFLIYLLFISIYRGIYQSVKTKNLYPFIGTIDGLVTGLWRIVRYK